MSRRQAPVRQLGLRRIITPEQTQEPAPGSLPGISDRRSHQRISRRHSQGSATNHDVPSRQVTIACPCPPRNALMHRLDVLSAAHGSAALSGGQIQAGGFPDGWQSCMICARLLQLAKARA